MRPIADKFLFLMSGEGRLKDNLDGFGGFPGGGTVPGIGNSFGGQKNPSRKFKQTVDRSGLEDIITILPYKQYVGGFPFLPGASCSRTAQGEGPEFGILGKKFFKGRIIHGIIGLTPNGNKLPGGYG
jgi:hypothetical protein